MLRITRRQAVRTSIVGGAAITTGTAAAAPDKTLTPSTIEDIFLPDQLTIEKIAAENGVKFTKLEYAKSSFWVAICDFLSGGVPHALIGIYAPDDAGLFHRCLLTESWAAGNIKAAVDPKTGMLELRETANSELKGQLVLACNLRTIGTQHSIEAK